MNSVEDRLTRGKSDFKVCSSVLFKTKIMDASRSFVESTTSSLGPLEKQVLQAVWARGTATVREVREDGRLWQTYPTIMTTMDRLFKKGLLDCVTEGRAFRYSAKYSPA